MTNDTTQTGTTEADATEEQALDASQKAAETDETTVESEAVTEAAEDDERGNKEAAKYRRKLREAEAERDTLAATVTALQRTQAEAAAAEILQKPAALWSIGTEISDLLADDGTIDVEKVHAAARTAIDDGGLASKQIGFHMDMTGRNTGHRRPSDLFTEAFSPRRS